MAGRQDAKTRRSNVSLTGVSFDVGEHFIESMLMYRPLHCTAVIEDVRASLHQ